MKSTVYITITLPGGQHHLTFDLREQLQCSQFDSWVKACIVNQYSFEIYFSDDEVSEANS